LTQGNPTNFQLKLSEKMIWYGADTMMRVWLICFFMLFALAEFFKWLRGFSVPVPLPIYILGGVFLAVASNYDKIFGYYISNASVITPVEISQEIPKLASPANSTPISGLISSGISESDVQESAKN
jgi:hypothetical protein